MPESFSQAAVVLVIQDPRNQILTVPGFASLYFVSPFVTQEGAELLHRKKWSQQSSGSESMQWEKTSERKIHRKSASKGHELRPKIRIPQKTYANRPSKMCPPRPMSWRTAPAMSVPAGNLPRSSWPLGLKDIKRPSGALRCEELS